MCAFVLAIFAFRNRNMFLVSGLFSATWADALLSACRHSLFNTLASKPTYEILGGLQHIRQFCMGRPGNDQKPQHPSNGNPKDLWGGGWRPPAAFGPWPRRVARRSSRQGAEELWQGLREQLQSLGSVARRCRRAGGWAHGMWVGGGWEDPWKVCRVHESEDF